MLPNRKFSLMAGAKHFTETFQGPAILLLGCLQLALTPEDHGKVVEVYEGIVMLSPQGFLKPH